MDNKKSGSRTLLMSVLMSAPGPVVMGIGLMSGRSSTQIADFVRRSAELLGIIVSFAVYSITNSRGVSDERKKAAYEKYSNIFVALMMCIGGIIMIALALTASDEDKGNVIPALCIALLGAVANTVFWRKYTSLVKKSPNAILSVQARLYGAKSLVDICVSVALISVAFFPASAVSAFLDTAGSVVVAGYLVWCGVRTVRENLEK